MKKIIVTSTNPVKINAVLKGFNSMFPREKFQIRKVAIESGVNDQPMSDEETLKGAENRVNSAMKNFPKADYYVGLEGGLEKLKGKMTSFSWVVVKSKQKIGRGKSVTYFLPKSVTKLIKEGKELGDAMDHLFKTKNILLSRREICEAIKSDFSFMPKCNIVTALGVVTFLKKTSSRFNKRIFGSFR